MSATSPSSRLPVEAVTADFVPTSRPDVVGVDVDGEIVLYDEARRVLHRLNPTASALWLCLDGSGTLADIAADIADVYQADPAAVLA
ncbi:MAG: PqqD family protein, partial [Acidimicrobiales bacterium]